MKMPNIEAILSQINKEIVPQFEEKLRAHLAERDKEWLIEQIVRLSLDAHSLEEMDRKHVREVEKRKRQARAERVKKLDLDDDKLKEFVHRYKAFSREQLIQDNFLSVDAPAKGGEMITNISVPRRGSNFCNTQKTCYLGSS